MPNFGEPYCDSKVTRVEVNARATFEVPPASDWVCPFSWRQAVRVQVLDKTGNPVRTVICGERYTVVLEFDEYPLGTLRSGAMSGEEALGDLRKLGEQAWERFSLLNLQG